MRWKIFPVFLAAMLMKMICSVSAAEYDVRTNLLYGLSADAVTFSAGSITTDGGQDSTVLWDGIVDSVVGYSGTRWAVESNQYDAEMRIDFGKLEKISKIYIENGYATIRDNTAAIELLTDFEIQYWDGTDYQTAAEIHGNNERHKCISFERCV